MRLVEAIGVGAGMGEGLGLLMLGLGGLGWPVRPDVLRLGQLTFGPGSEIVGLGPAELDQTKGLQQK